MKESMNVAKTLAWSLTPNNVKKTWINEFEETKCQGLHIHCPEGAVSKDGPSAGAAITCAIYSIFNSKKILNYVAVTGEVTLEGEITAIGGLKEKILGGIKNGVTKFLYPSDNDSEFFEFMKMYRDHPKLSNIQFEKIKRIEQLFEHVFENTV
jgi:ATP-dependent Lon protease